MNGKERVEYYKGLDLEAFLEKPDVKVFIGPNYEHYKKIWLKDYHTKDKQIPKILFRMHWNTMAVLCWPLWYGYRKMYGMVMGLGLLLIVLISLIEYYGSGLGSFSGGLLVLGLIGKNYYLQYVLEKVHIIEQEPSPEIRDYLVQKYGGVSILSGIVATVLFLAGIVLASMLVEYLKKAA